MYHSGKIFDFRITHEAGTNLQNFVPANINPKSVYSVAMALYTHVTNNQGCRRGGEET